MTKKERMKAMIAGEPIDYLPSQLDFVPHRLARLLEELNIPSGEFDEWACNHFYHVYPLTESCYYSSGSATDQKLIDMAVEKGLIDSHPDDRYIYDNFHVVWLKNVDGIRDVVNPAKDGNLDDLAWPGADVPELFDHVLDDLAQHSEEYYVVGLQHLGLFERSWLILGYQNLMTALASDIALVEELMDRILEFHVGLAHRFVALGVDAVRTGDDYGTQRNMQFSPKMWRQLIKPRLAKIWEVYREADITIMHHSCGNIEAIIPDLVELGLDVLHPVQPLAMPIERLAEKFGKQIAFHGGIDTQQLLPFGTPDEVLAAIKHCVATLGANGRYIIAPSQEIMNDVPTENIKALVDGIKKYRDSYFTSGISYSPKFSG